MSNPFIDFSEEEYEKYLALFSYNTELEDGKIRVWGGGDTYLYLVKHKNGEVYMQITDDEDDYVENGNNIYLADCVWWTRLNKVDRLADDVKRDVILAYYKYI